MNVARLTVASFVVLFVLPSFNAPRAQSSRENADFKLAINLYDDGLYDLAAEQLNLFITNFPNTANNVEARFYLGLTQMKLKRFDDARLTFQTFALSYQDNPKAPEAWMHTGECFVEVKNYREAALAFERVHVFHSKNKIAPEALVRASKYFALAGQPEDTRRVLRITLQEYPNSSAALSARTRLGQIYFEEGNLVQAQTELRRVIESDAPSDAKAQALLTLGTISQATGQMMQAQSSYEEIIAKHKSSSAIQSAYLNLGRIQSSTGKLSDAVANFRKCLAEKGPIDSTLISDANSEMGNAYLAMGDASNALTSYQNAVAYATTSAGKYTTLWRIAGVAARQNDFDRSNNACERLLNSPAPEIFRKKALIRLALNGTAQQDYAGAVQHFTRFLDQYPLDAVAADINFRVAQLTENDLHDSRKAATLYEQFLTRFTRSRFIDDACFGAARCYSTLGEFERAVQLYREITTKYPSSEFRGSSEDSIRSIETFELKDRGAGVEKLALVLGDMVNDKDKVGLSFRLGEICFHDLKNYSAAAAQFSIAMSSGMSDHRFIDALYYRAKSLEFLSWKDKAHVPRAIEAYQTFLQSYPDESRSDDARLSVFMLNATSPQTAHAAYAQVMSANPNFHKQDMLLEHVGFLEEQADSITAALSTYGTILREFRSSPVTDDVTYRRVPLLLRLGMVDSAMHEGERYLGAFPNGSHSAEITARLADLNAHGGSAERASAFYKQLREKFSYTSFADSAQYKLADANAAAGKYDEAISTYSDLLAGEADSPLNEDAVDSSLLLSLGKTYHLAGNTVKARDYLLRVITHEATGKAAGAAYTILGHIAEAEGNIELATVYFRQAGNVTPGASASKEVADLLFDNGSYADAIKQYTALLQTAKVESDRRHYEERIVIALYRDDQLASAEKEAGAFLKKYEDTENEAAAFNLAKGLYYYRKEDYLNAQKWFERVADKYDDTPSGPEATYWMGNTLLSTKKQPAALKKFEELLKSHPNSPIIPRAHLALGNIYYDMEKWDESIRHYKAIVDNPHADKSLLPFALSNLIEAYETAGIFDAALQLTRKYLESYPNNEDSFDKKIKIGILYQRLGYNDQSVLQLQSLLDQASSDLEGEIRYYIAEANYNKGDYQQAILDFLKVPYLVTKKGKLDWTANSLYMAGQSYEKVGRYDQALTMYQQITDRQGIDETFKVAAKKEMDRVKLVLSKQPEQK